MRARWLATSPCASAPEIMPPELLRSGFRFGVVILILAIATLVFLQPSKPEFWASVAAAIVAAVFLGGLLILLSITHQSPPGKG
jgi:hypothetical protein